MAACLPWLWQQIETIQPQIIVLLGSTALKNLIKPDALITKLRSQWLESKSGIKIMPTYHPAALLMPVILAPVTAVQAMKKSKIDTSSELELLLEQDICELVDYENIGKDQIEGSGDVEVQYANLILKAIEKMSKLAVKHGPEVKKVWISTRKWATHALRQAKKYTFEGPGRGEKIFQVRERKDPDNILFRLDHGDIANTGTKFFPLP